MPICPSASTTAAHSCRGGSSTQYRVTVTNLGPDAATGVGLATVTSANLSGLVWACSGTATNCAAASGNGPLAMNINLPAGSTLDFLVDALVAPLPEAPAAFSASLTPPAGLQDPTPGDEAASDIDAVGVFRSGFE